MRARRSTTPPPYTSYLHPYTTTTTRTQPLQHYYTIHLYGVCRELASIETESINRKRIRKKAPTGQQSLSRRRRRRRRQSPCQQAQVMINVLERSSSRSLLVRVLTGGCPTLSSGRNVLGILAQPSPSPHAVPASITDSKCIKVPMCISLPPPSAVPLSILSPVFPFFLIYTFILGGSFTPLLPPPHRPYTTPSLRETLARKYARHVTLSGNANRFPRVQYQISILCNATFRRKLSPPIFQTLNLNKSRLNSDAIFVNAAYHHLD